MAEIFQPEAVAEAGLEHPDTLTATPDGRVAAVAGGSALRVVDMGKTGSSPGEPSAAASPVWPYPTTVNASPSSNPSRRATPCASRASTGATPGPRRSAARRTSPGNASPAGGALPMVCGNGPTPAPGRLARFDPATGRVLGERAIERFKATSAALTVGPDGRLIAVANSYKDLEIASLPGLQTVSADHDPAGDAADAVLLDDACDRLVVGRGSNIYAGPASESDRALVGEFTRATPAAAAALVSSAQSDHVRRLNWLPDGRWLAAGDALTLAEGETARLRPAAGATAHFPLTGGRVLALLKAVRLEIRAEIPRRSSTASRAISAATTPKALFDWRRHVFLREWTLPGSPFRVFVLDSGGCRPVVAVVKNGTLHYLPTDGPPVALPMPFCVNGYCPAPLASHADPPPERARSARRHCVVVFSGSRVIPAAKQARIFPKACC